VRDPSLRSELALERSEGMTAVLKLTPMRDAPNRFREILRGLRMTAVLKLTPMGDAPNRFNEWVVAVLSLILLFSTLTIYPG